LFGQLLFLMKRVALHTLGCKLNYAETATIGKQFVGEGYQVVDIDEPSDVVVINTCSVTERADKECRQLVRRALRHSPDAFVAVVGCYSQLRHQEIASIEGVDLVLGSKEKFNVLQYLGDSSKHSTADVYVSCVEDIRETHPASSAGFEDRTRAFLKIQDGCDYLCTYCTIPQARGASRSIEPSQIVSQADEIARQGYQEIVITGVNVGDYGKGINSNLLQLLKQLVKVDGIQRIRISSIEPNLLTDELLEFWFAEDKLCKHWHIPLQSGSDTILKSMRRRYLTDVYSKKIETIKHAIPSAGIGADVIVGFPGETEQQFDETYSFLADQPISYLHVFSYSARPNTPAMQFTQQVSPQEKSNRSERLRQLSVRKRRLFYQGFEEKIVDVLFETRHSNELMTGLTGEYVHVNVATAQEITNQLLHVKILHTAQDSCSGVLISS
jgi:threonylcarbamoyladenosine tRNA methylthiotransferase MtaB